MKSWVAIDQYGDKVYFHAKTPRAGLMKELNAKHAYKIYLDRKDGKTMHVGYVVQRRWFDIYQRWEQPA